MSAAPSWPRMKFTRRGEQPEICNDFESLLPSLMSRDRNGAPSFGYDFYQLRPFAGVFIDLQDTPDAWGVEFILEEIRLQGSRLL